MKLTVPELCLVVLIGPSGAGKSTFARQHFLPTEVLSSDACRALVSDDANDQEATRPAFEVLHFIASKRLAAGRLTVVDATNVQPEARKPLVQLARDHDLLPVAIVLDLPESLCQARNRARPDRDFGEHVIRRQHQQLHRSLRGLRREGFRYIYTLTTPEEVASAVIERQRLWTNRRDERGPFDIIGDVHGCFEELCALLLELGYGVQEQTGEEGRHFSVQPPEGRRAIFLGDLVDRGPNTPDVLRLVMAMVAAGNAFCVPGNHDVKLLRKLQGRNVKIAHGLAESLAQLEVEPPPFREEVVAFLDGLISHYVLDEGKLVVAHAGMKEPFQGRASARVRDFALFGETTGETDEFGLPVRYPWAEAYRGKALVAYGHTPVPEPLWLNNTVNLDTGCVFGGHLTALRYPERETVSVPAYSAYHQPIRPFPAAVSPPGSTPQQQHDSLLELADVTGKRFIETGLRGTIVIREEQTIAALEVMSRFAIDPRWLIYLPPTLSPSETSQQPGLLEHPAEAFDYYRTQQVEQVVCQEKHMGSRAVVIVCKDEEVARRRFGTADPGLGACYTRTGRRFFTDATLERAFLAHVQAALTAAGFWREFDTDWICLDGEIMPWSAKAQQLIRQQYAAVGAAGRAALPPAIAVLEQALARDLDVVALHERYSAREAWVAAYTDAYRRYVWPVNSVTDLRFAPFHLLVTEGAAHTKQTHLWHMEMLARLGQGAGDGSILHPTAYQVVDLRVPEQQAVGTDWWEALTARGGEGMVVKPLDFVARGPRGLIQPAIKCRGREYLRLIYGPEYTAPENLERLRNRGLAAKRSLALREFALGVEALESFVRGEPLRRVHECVFGVLALESEPVDPRL
jgi:protein phosphatase